MKYKQPIMAGAAGVAAAILLNMVGCGGSGAPEASKPAATSEPDPLPLIAAQIDKGIALLEAGKNEEALEALASPSTVKNWKSGDEFDGVVKEFVADGKANALLVALKGARGQTPKLNEKKTEAEFPQEGDSKGLIFEKQKDGWYLRN